VQRQYGWLSAEVVARLGDAYGTRLDLLLSGCRSVADMGEHFGAGLYQREVEFMIAQEWARSAEDVLWRRSKLGLRLNAEQVEALDWFVRRSVAVLQTSRSAAAPLRRAG
jgi:glycerol-3-phosphate dehydrogenase